MKREEGNAGPVVSVVIPFLNAQRFLAAAIDSVLAQTFTDWEVVLVDDGSSDASSAIARDYAKTDRRIRVLEHPGHENRGQSASRNLALAEARGEFVAPLDADDIWEESKLEEQVAVLRAHPNAALVYGSPLYWRSWEAGAKHGDFTPALRLETDRIHPPPLLALRSYPLGPGSAPCPSDLLLRRSSLEAVGGFEDDFRGIYSIYEDQALLIKIYLHHEVYVSSRQWTKYRLHEGQVSASVTPADYWTIRRRFLAWLEDYLDEHGIADVRLRRAVTAAGHPTLLRIRQLKSAVWRRIVG